MFIIVNKPYGQAFKTVSIDFTRTIEKENEHEIVTGKLFSDGIKQTVIISKPLNQWMILKKNNVLIYYPDTRRAIRLKSKTNTSLGFFQAFIGVTKEDYGLSEMGYVMEKSEIRSDTLVTYWLPPEKAEKYLGEFILAYANDRIVYTDVKNADGQTIAYTTYNNFYLHRATYFPLHITTHLSNNNLDTYEEIEFFNPSFNQPLPLNVINFTLPDGVLIEEKQW